jgi:hypothetical protein
MTFYGNATLVLALEGRKRRRDQKLLVEEGVIEK